MTETYEEKQHEEEKLVNEPAATSSISPPKSEEAEKLVNEPAATSSTSPPKSEEAKKWGTHIMGHPTIPSAHPDNQKAASWNATEHQDIYQHPYVIYSPIDKRSGSPYEYVVHAFDSWTNKAESLARNIWHNLKTGPSVSEVAWGKMNLTAKAMTEGGFESIFTRTFETDPNEKLKKTFACYLSTATGPVAGTLYLSTARAAFCSDRPLSFTAPSGQQAWSYYKVTIPLGSLGAINPVIIKENSAEKYIQIITVDNHDFWFMGFVNFEKATHHLLEASSSFRANGSHADAQAVVS